MSALKYSRNSNAFTDAYLGSRSESGALVAQVVTGQTGSRSVVKNLPLGVCMRRTAMILSSVILALASLIIPASAQTTGLIGGGFTALPTSPSGPISSGTAASKR